MLWSGRFTKNINEKVLNFTNSLDIDKILYKYDIKGSIAHVKSLNQINIIDEKELKIILDALEKILLEFEENIFIFKEEDEDIHMAIERRLIEMVGEVGKKLHTGRSRNDQVILDIRMFAMDNEKNIIKKIKYLIETLTLIAENNIDVIMPGFTHMQDAQPVLFSHYILAFANKFLRDLKRFENAYYFADIYPLGSGALAGTPYNIDRESTGKSLNFTKISINSMDMVSTRDFILDFLYASTVFAINASRLAEDFIIYSSQEFCFLEMDDSFTTGSSIMPQKKNPDVMELIRGKSERILGSLNAFSNVMKALPMTYDRDMQEDKFYFLLSLNTINDFLDILPEILKTTKINSEIMREGLNKGFLYATRIADYLVKKGIPFREAHKITGNIVNFCIKNKKSFFDLSIDEYNNISSEKVFNNDLFEIFDPKKSVEEQVIFGSTSTKSVKNQIKIIRDSLN